MKQVYLWNKYIYEISIFMKQVYLWNKYIYEKKYIINPITNNKNDIITRLSLMLYNDLYLL